MRYDAFEALTLDCYGTLIDWETGLLEALRPILAAHGVRADADVLLEAFARYEAEAERGAYMRYRDVLATALGGVAAELGFAPDPGEAEAFAGSAAGWPAFSDSGDALRRLARRFRLAVITNCDDDLFEASRRRLGVEFEVVVTAEQVGAYKPDTRGFHVAFERLGLRPDRVLHVAQSLYHDHVPARALGLSSVWIDRRAGREGHGATPPADAAPDARFADLASFAAAAA